MFLENQLNLQLGDQTIIQLGCVTQKGPLWPESLSYQKKDGARGRARPSFGMTVLANQRASSSIQCPTICTI